MECYNKGALSQILVSSLILVKITGLLNIQRQEKRTLGNLRVIHNKYRIFQIKQLSELLGSL